NHVIGVGPRPRRLIGRRPYASSAYISQIEELAPMVARWIAAPSRDRLVAMLAVASPGTRQQDRVVAVGDKVRPRRRCVVPRQSAADQFTLGSGQLDRCGESL